jgi:hypothetical protein
MTFKKLLLVSTILAGTAAFAQEPLGTVTNVHGVVTATQGASGMTVAPGTTIQNGMRFVTTSNASVTLHMNSGCTVNVPPAHGVTVLQSMNCQQLAEAVQPVPATTVLGQTGDEGFAPTTTLVNGVIAAGALGVLAGAIDAASESTPNGPLSGH